MGVMMRRGLLILGLIWPAVAAAAPDMRGRIKPW
jgi:hypothetical protein